MGKRISYSEDTERAVIEYYLAGFSLKDCGEKFFHNRSNYRIVRKILLSNQIHLRTFEESRDRHYANIRASVQRKYGADNVSQLESVKRKKEQTCLSRYGVPQASKSQEVKDRATQKMISKYGVRSYAQTEA